jgi:outer membrane murein-binding lipoprotein Lpp
MAIGAALMLSGCADNGNNAAHLLLQQQNATLQQQNAELNTRVNELNKTVGELSQQKAAAPAAEPAHIEQHEAEEEVVPTKVSATGYGAEDKFKDHTPGQRRLLAIRAAKMDAFRSLAEAVRGFNISGHTSVNAAITESDKYKSYVDAFIRGAQVTDITPLKQGTYEVTVELVLDKRFFECLDNPKEEKCKAPTSNAYLPGFASGG